MVTLNDQMQAYLANHLRAREVKEIVRTYTLTDGFVVEVKDYSAVGVDDRFYGRYGYSTLLHRGTCCVTVNSEEAPRWIFGLPKFGNECPELHEANQWVFTEKANGECGHVAMLDSDHVVIGSKNVHFVLSAVHFLEDLEMYVALEEDRLSVAIKIAKLLREQGLLTSGILSHLAENKLTMVVEACFDNHIVRYESCHCVATCFMNERVVLSPVEAYHVCERFGFAHVEYDVAASSEEFELLKAKYQNWERDSEGAVVYAQGESGVFTLYKVKHPLYVVKRAARELIKRRANYAAWNTRMKALHVAVPESVISSLLQFYAWILTTLPDYSSDTVQEEFGKLFSEFSALGTEIEDPIAVIDRVDESKNRSTLVLGLCGVPGCGKSYLRNVIANNTGYKIAYVNQDELNSSKKKFLNALKMNSQQSLDILVVDKSNVSEEMRGDVCRYFERVYWVVFDDADMVNTCWKRIKDRGVYHPSLVYSYTTLGIIRGFYQSFERPVGDNVVTIQIKDSMEGWLDEINRACGLELRLVDIARKQVLPNIKYWMISLPENQHITLAYGPTEEETEHLIPHFGEEVEIATEVAFKTARVQAAPVLPHPFLREFCRNAIPHITLWTADGAQAMESNEMLAHPESASCEPHVRRYTGIVSFAIK